MATFGEIIYAVLDIMKERSDDAYYTEEHVKFFATKMRALLLERKYRQTRNSVFTPMSEENKQEICIDLEKANLLESGCDGGWLKSVNKIPDTLSPSTLDVFPVNKMLHSMVTFIPEERMPFVGYNKWLKNIIYCSRSSDGYLYLHSNNPEFLFLERVRANGVFADPEKALELSCSGSGDGTACNYLEAEFPLESALVASCIEMTAQELLGSRYAPEDKKNNAKDDFSEAAVAQPKQNASKKTKESEE